MVYNNSSCSGVYYSMFCLYRTISFPLNLFPVWETVQQLQLNSRTMNWNQSEIQTPRTKDSNMKPKTIVTPHLSSVSRGTSEELLKTKPSMVSWWTFNIWISGGRGFFIFLYYTKKSVSVKNWKWSLYFECRCSTIIRSSFAPPGDTNPILWLLTDASSVPDPGDEAVFVR